MEMVIENIYDIHIYGDGDGEGEGLQYHFKSTTDYYFLFFILSLHLQKSI